MATPSVPVDVQLCWQDGGSRGSLVPERYVLRDARLLPTVEHLRKALLAMSETHDWQRAQLELSKATIELAALHADDSGI